MEKVCCVATSAGFEHRAPIFRSRTFTPAPSAVHSVVDVVEGKRGEQGEGPVVVAVCRQSRCRGHIRGRHCCCHHDRCWRRGRGCHHRLRGLCRNIDVAVALADDASCHGHTAQRPRSWGQQRLQRRWWPQPWRRRRQQDQSRRWLDLLVTCWSQKAGRLKTCRGRGGWPLGDARPGRASCRKGHVWG